MRVTEPAQHAVTQAKREAGRLGHDRVGTEHLLLGLLNDEECLAVATLGRLGIAPETVRRRVEAAIGQGPGQPSMGFGLPTTKAFTLVLSLAGREAMGLEGDRLGTEHLLLGLASEGEGVAARVLQERRASLPVVCWLRWQVEVQRLASGESVKQPLQLPGRRRWRP
jgi:ATP-dependent Clp protease ATP-binding subunit ClpC